MSLFELNSFMLKFRHLSSVGYDVDLNISSKNGQTSVSLTANLGILPPPCPLIPPKSSPSNSFSCNGSNHSRGPAYRRRQEKRQHLQANQPNRNTNTEEVSSSEIINKVKSTEEVENIVCKDATEEVVYAEPIGIKAHVKSNQVSNLANPSLLSSRNVNDQPNLGHAAQARPIINHTEVAPSSSNSLKQLSSLVPSDCCLHDCRNDGDHPPDGKCCYHRCRIGVKRLT